MKILICGDSFAADWSVKYTDYPGWPNLLAQVHDVTNLAQAGVSEYRIWQQLSSASLKSYDLIIIAHTSPFRIPIDHHPTHHRDPLHKNCDLIYLDVKNADQTCELAPIIEYFEKYFSTEYACFVHNLIIKEELSLLDKQFAGPVLNITNLNWDNLDKTKNFTSFESIRKKHPGLINHYSQQGNQIIFDTLLKKINEIIL